MQLDLFEHVAGAYAQPVSGKLSNKEAYRIIAGRAGIPKEQLEEKIPVGSSGQLRSPAKRKIRWYQQTLKMLGLLQPAPGERGVWELTQKGKKTLQTIRDDVACLGFSTKLGIAIWGNCNRVYERINEPIMLVLTSPPYPLKRPRAYGNPKLEDYVDFICHALEPLVKNLIPGGNIVLSLSNDIFVPGLPSRSLYLERLTIALCDRLGLSLMDRIIWQSNKPPGPLQWASVRRVQLNVAYEPVLWFCNDPARCISDNRRILKPHTEKHSKLIAGGGEKRNATYGDGSNRIREGSYGRQTNGSIEKNVLNISNVCMSQREYKKNARQIGLVPHSAPMPLELARRLIKFLTRVNDLVVDLFSGSLTTPLGCELEGRRWIASENVYDFIKGGATRFEGMPGFRFYL